MSERYYAVVGPKYLGYDGLIGADGTKKRRFVAYIFWVGWQAIFQFGFSVCLYQPNFEIHFPCAFLRVGWVRDPWYGTPTGEEHV